MVVWGWHRGGGEKTDGVREGIPKGPGEICGDNAYVYYLDYSDGFTILYIQN